MPILTPPAPIIEIFYAPSCGPCRLELPVIAEFSHQDGVKLRVVIVSEDARARADLARLAPALRAEIVTRAEPSPAALLRRSGDVDGMLPFARSIAASGVICAQWGGRLTLVKARELAAACSGSANSPASPRS